MRRLLHSCAGAAILFHFLWFSQGCLGTHFAPDEMMNMGWAWDAGGPKIAAQIVKFWEPFYRPVGAFYYWTLYQFFHLDPVPFRIFDVILLVANLGIFYWLARSLQFSRPVAWLAVFLFSYHERVSLWTVFNGAWTYDRLCFTFSALTLATYCRLRLRGGGVWPRLAVVALFILALGAKEMAVVIPILLVAYELCYYPLRPLARSTILFLGLLGGMSLLYAVGKTRGPEALAAKAGYRLQPLTVGTYLTSQGRHMQDYFFLQEKLPPARAALVLAGLLAVVALARSGRLAFALAFLVVAPLPIAFVDRSGGTLYIPLAGWCLFAAESVACLAAALSRRPSVRQAVFATASAALAYWLVTNNAEYWHSEQSAMLQNGDVTWRAITDLNQLRPNVRPGAKIYVEKNPFEGWDMWFILALWADVKPIDVVITGKNAPLGAETPGLTGIVTMDAAGHLVYRAVPGS